MKQSSVYARLFSESARRSLGAPGSGARGRLAVISLFLPGLLLGFADAHAQGLITAPPPIRSTVDANGVNLVTGALTVSTPTISIGQGEGALSYVRQLIGTGWTDNVTGTVSMTTQGYVVSVGGGSELFTKAGSIFTNAEGLASTLTLSGSTYTYTTGGGVVMVFSPGLTQGASDYSLARLTSATYPDGKVVTYNYQTTPYSSRLQSVTNNFGYQLKFTYSLNNPQSAADVPAYLKLATAIGINRAIDYCSPTADSCSGFTQSWPTVTYTLYPAALVTISVTDPVGNISLFAYNASSQLAGITRPGASANTTAISYDTSGRVAAISNSARTVGPSGGGPGTWSYDYSTAGSTITTTVTDPLAHLRTVVASTTTSLPTSDTDGLARTTSYVYDSFGRLTQITRPETDYTQYAYDARGNVTTTTVFPNNGPGHGSLQASANYDTTCASPAKCNSPNYVINANGGRTDYTYDTTHGVILTVTVAPATAGATRPQTRYSYSSLYAWYKNAGGSVVQGAGPLTLLTGTSSCATQASCAGTSDEVVSSIAYGVAGVANNLGATSAAAGPGNGPSLTSASTTYDVFGNVATTVGPLGSAQTTAYFYNANRQRTGVIGPLVSGASTYPAVRTTYSGAGQPTLVEQGTTTSQSGLSTFSSLLQQSAAYDGLGRVTQTSLASGGTTQSLTYYTYDNANRLTCTAARMNPAAFSSPPASACLLGATGTNGPDRITVNTYDAADQLTKVTGGYLSTTQVDAVTATYSANGHVATVKDAANNLSTVVYDPYDRVSQVQFPMPTTGAGASNPGDYEGYGYDNNGNVTSVRRRSGETITLTYDALNRTTLKHYPTGTSQDIYWGYDLLSRALYAHYGSAGGAGVDYAYDALGRPLSSTASGRTLSYQYDAVGNRTRLTFADTGANALYVSYVYDVLNRVTSIGENGATSGVGLLASYGYDSLGRRSSVTRAGGTGASTGYGYDGASRLQSLIQSLAGTAAVTYTFGYSAANQTLTRSLTNDTYTAHPAATTASYVANGLNQYASVGGTSFTHDARGDLTSDGTLAFTYSLDDQLLTGSAPTATALAYDPLGRLQTQTTGGATTTFLYDGSDLVGEYDGAGNILRRYVPGPGVDEPVVWYEGAGTATRRWLAADQQGSIIAWSDQNGVAGASYAYGAYGEPLTPAGASAWGGSRYRYTGQIEIPEAQLYHYKARAYDPGLGRFVQVDPAGYADSLNAYAYVGDDPVNDFDPTGLATGQVTDPGLIHYTGGPECGAGSPTDGSCGFVVTAERPLIQTILNVERQMVSGVAGLFGGGGDGGRGGKKQQNGLVCPAGVQMVSVSGSIKIPLLHKLSSVSIGFGLAIDPAGNVAVPAFGFVGAGKGSSESFVINYSTSNAKDFTAFNGQFYDAGGLVGLGVGGGVAKFAGAGGVTGTTYSAGEVAGASATGGTSYTDVGPSIGTVLCRRR